MHPGNEILAINGFGAAGMLLGAATVFGWGSSSTPSLGNRDLVILRENANVLAQRNGTNMQQFNLYRSYTDASNYSRLALVNNAVNAWLIAAQSAGTGVSTDGVGLQANGSGSIYFNLAGSSAWRFDGATGALLVSNDNAYDIGASGANRPKNLYIAGKGVFGGDISSSANINIWSGISALATTATSGFLGVNSCAGAPTGVPASIPTGQKPMVFDSTNNILYVYNGSWKGVAVS